MIKRLLIIIALFFGLLWGISVYLGPDDLSNCKNGPSEVVGCEKADAIVAVSGGDTESRTAEAISLYERGWANLLIFSGAAADKSGPSNAEAMKQIALASGVPATAIVLDQLSETTAENAINTKSIADQYNLKSVIVVTSAYHQRRTSMEFAKRLTDVVVRSHPVSHDDQWSGFWWTTPYGWYLVISELIKILIVGVWGRLV